MVLAVFSDEARQMMKIHPVSYAQAKPEARSVGIGVH